MVSRRGHNRLAKDAVRATLADHWQKTTRKHFQYGAKARYSYFTRSRKYRRRKQRTKGHDIDLLFSGATRARMCNGGTPYISIGGAAEGGKKGLTGKYRLSFPFGGGAEKGKPRRISRRILNQLKIEVARWSSDEIAASRDFMLAHYMAGLKSLGRRRGSRRRAA